MWFWEYRLKLIVLNGFKFIDLSKDFISNENYSLVFGYVIIEKGLYIILCDFFRYIIK